jgi:putative FmdB family regulatory protein
MPIYEYQCDACGSQRELLLKPGEAARPTCATCRKRMRRVISQTAFVLKGSGWYVTDYPSEARKKGLEGEKAPAPTAETTAAKKDTGQAEKKTAVPPKAPAEKKGAKKKG